MANKESSIAYENLNRRIFPGAGEYGIPRLEAETFDERGYAVERVRCCDMFGMSGHVETVALLTKKIATREV